MSHKTSLPPSFTREELAKLREEGDAEAKVSLVLARQYAKEEREEARKAKGAAWRARMAKLKAEREVRKAKRAAELAANPTVAWRAPRRKDWAEKHSDTYRKPRR